MFITMYNVDKLWKLQDEKKYKR